MNTAKLTSLIIDKVQSPGATLKEIADLIQMDKGLSDRILSLVNRSYCAIPGGVPDILNALQYVSITTLIQVFITSSP